MTSYDEIMVRVEGVRSGLAEWGHMVGVRVPVRCGSVEALQRAVRDVATADGTMATRIAARAMQDALYAVKRGDNAGVLQWLESSATHLRDARAEREEKAGVPASTPAGAPDQA